ncbi:hypothetical protein [Streptomyces sp. NPDC091212]|uniref:hypothetical protein n=1 Tax=Streptomyces sp. NPDC091212 TaxID=3155191 RepID=UPI0034480BC1
MNTIQNGTYIEARDDEGRKARGTVVAHSLGFGGRILSYEVRNPVSGIVSSVYPESYEITVR